MRICYFGAYDVEYPRNRVIRLGLERNGIRVVECNVSQRLRSWQRYPLLLTRYLKICSGCNVILVAEFGQSLVPLAWLLSRACKIPLIFDAFTSFYDTAVSDRRIVKVGSSKARYYFLLDKLAVSLSDAILVDTARNCSYFMTHFLIDNSKCNVVYVGVDDEHFYPRQLDNGARGHFLVQFYGTFIPLHGIQYIIEAAKILEGRTDIKFELIGKGQTFDEMHDLAQRLNSNNITFSEPIPYSALPQRIARADLCLGIFGDTDKALRVIPNKVYQTMAMGKPVVTGDSPAIREVFNEKHLGLCRMADANSLANTILKLKEDEELRKTIARRGYMLIKEKFTPTVIGREVKSVVESIL